MSKKERILNIEFSQIPDVHIRVISGNDILEVINNKKKYPFVLNNTVRVKVITSKREFEYIIYNGFTWNGADIPRAFWRIIGARTDNDFLIASMVHDYMLEFKKYILFEILKKQISVKEYRRMTSLIFRFIIKQQGTNTIKANVMSWCVDVFQMLNRRAWQCL